MVSSEAAVPSWRGHAQGRGLNCLSRMPPSSAASGAEPPRYEVSGTLAEIRVRKRMEVFSLAGLMKRSARRISTASTRATATETPSTTSTGMIEATKPALGCVSMPALALPRASAYSVDRVDSTRPRSVTAPAARMSATTRVSTRGEAAMATRASGPATSGAMPSQPSTRETST